MTYRFHSHATADMVMLAATGQQVLSILGKDPKTAGIVLAADIPAAMAALQAAVEADEATRADLVRQAQAKGEEPPPQAAVSLRMRVAPLLEMLRRSADEQADITWAAP